MERFEQLRIIWLTLVGGLAVWTAIAYGLLAFGGVGRGAFPAAVMPYGAAGVIAFMSVGLVVRRRLIARIPPGASEAERLQAYAVGTIVGLAMMEGGGLLLITLSLVADAPTWALAGGGAGVWMMILARPRREEVDPRPGGR